MVNNETGATRYTVCYSVQWELVLQNQLADTDFRLGRYEHELRCAINLSGTGVRLLGISSIERDADLDRECSNCILW